MKKVLAILAIAGFMVACNSSSDKKDDTTKDSSANSTMKSAADSANKMTNPAMDTTKMMPDTTKKM